MRLLAAIVLAACVLAACAHRMPPVAPREQSLPAASDELLRLDIAASAETDPGAARAGDTAFDCLAHHRSCP